MDYSIKNERGLEKILWLDALLGGTTALIGWLWYTPLTGILGLTAPFILTVATITFLYAALASILANQTSPSVRLIRLLIGANWLWTAISVGMLFIYFREATVLGVLFLVAQVVVVGGLAYLESNQLTATKTT